MARCACVSVPAVMDYRVGPAVGPSKVEGACVSGSARAGGTHPTAQPREWVLRQVRWSWRSAPTTTSTSALRSSIETTVGSPMVGDDFDDVADVVVLWWHDDDGDLVDALVDGLSAITSGGVVWLFTPKAGRDGHVEPSEIGEAARTAGLSSTKSTSAAADWAGTRLVAPKIGR